VKLQSEFGGKLVPEVDEGRCAVCRICSASCPFEAIKLDSESGKIILAAENCKLCGICPAAAISMPYSVIMERTISLLQHLLPQFGSRRDVTTFSVQGLEDKRILAQMDAFL